MPVLRKMTCRNPYATFFGSDIHVMLTTTVTNKAQKTNRFERLHHTSWPRESRLGCNALAVFHDVGSSHRGDQKMYLHDHLLKDKV